MKIALSHFRVRFLSIFLSISFYEHVLSSLRNPRTKFRAAGASGCGDMLKMGGNSTISVPGAFFIRFL